MNIILILISVAAIAWGLSAFFASKYSPLVVYDAPNARSLHDSPTPRTGGIAILIGIAVGWGGLYYIGYSHKFLFWIVPAIVLVASVSVLDDFLKLSALSRFVVHSVAATMLLTGEPINALGIFGMLIAWFVIVWILNLYNFMDGMDGLAAGMAFFGFGVLGLSGWLQGEWEYACYSWVVGIASGGFLITNFPPARIFMGDAGSIPLGLMVSAFSIWGILNEIFPVWLPLLTFSPFIVDATVTILRRLIQGEKIWHAHRSHYYQRMVLAGWGHKRTAYAEYLLMIACGSTSLVALQLGGHVWWIMAGIWTMIYLIILFLIEKKVSVNA